MTFRTLLTNEDRHPALAIAQVVGPTSDPLLNSLGFMRLFATGTVLPAVCLQQGQDEGGMPGQVALFEKGLQRHC